MFWLLTSALAGSITIEDGSRPVKDIYTAIHARRADFEKCFTADQTVKMRIVVGADGRVSDAKFSLTDVDQQAATCITRGAVKLRFAPSTDSGPTTYMWMATRASLDEAPPLDRPGQGEVHVTGGLSKEHVKSVIERNHAHLAFCMRKARTTDPSISSATLDLHFGIDANGKVVSAEGKYSTLGDGFAECVANRAIGLSFDKPDPPGMTHVVIPLAF